MEDISKEGLKILNILANQRRQINRIRGNIEESKKQSHKTISTNPIKTFFSKFM